MNASTSFVLNILRWVAAFAVLIGHIRHLVLVDFSGVAEKNILLKGLYFLSGFGHEAVIVFFVISGFLVGGTTLEKWRRSGVNQRNYWIARVSRIYTVLIPALLIGLALDLLGSHYFDATGLYSNPEAFRINSVANTMMATMDARTLLGNLFMLQGVLVGNLGTNSPLWSLSYEWWYYTMFSLVAVILARSGGPRWAACLGLIALLFVLPLEMVLWGAFWLLGVAVFEANRISKFRLPLWLGFAIFAALLTYSRLSHNIENYESREPVSAAFMRDCAVGIAVTVLIYATASSSFVIVGLEKFAAKLADFSYSMYLIHFPFMMLLAAVLADSGVIGVQLQPSPVALAYCFCLTAALMAIAFLFSQVTEAHTSAVRTYLLRKMAPKGH